MTGYTTPDLETLTQDNTDYRRVEYTGRYLQLVLMSLQPGEEIGEEVHEDHDQFFRIEQGEGVATINGARTPLARDVALIVPAGARHNIINSGDTPLRLYTIYGPPEHEEGFVAATRDDAEAADEHFDGTTTE